MANDTKQCNNCGAICDVKDTYCKRCSQSFPSTPVNEEPIVEGVDDADLQAFIGKNQDYYTKQFAKVRGKKFFLQLNLPALFFGAHWFFYRKMYKVGILSTAALLLISFAVTLLVSMIFAPVIQTYTAARQAYLDFQDSGEERFYFDEDGYLQTNETYERVSHEHWEARQRILFLQILSCALILAANILFRLLANAFYKQHAKENAFAPLRGGTSVPAIFVGGIATDIVAGVVSELLMLLLVQIPIVAQFQAAINTPWA